MYLETNTYFINSHWSKTSWPDEPSAPISSLHPRTGCVSFPRLLPASCTPASCVCPSSSGPCSLPGSPLCLPSRPQAEPPHTLHPFGSTVLRAHERGARECALPPVPTPARGLRPRPRGYGPRLPAAFRASVLSSSKWGTVTLGDKWKYSRCNCNCAVPD